MNFFQVYLVGTAHFSKESCDDVKKVIESVQPDIVMIELCKVTHSLLCVYGKEAKNLLQIVSIHFNQVGLQRRQLLHTMLTAPL